MTEPELDRQPTSPKQLEGVCPYATRDLAAVILNFIEKVNDVELYNYQRVLSYRIVESLLLNDGACITALYSRQSGKSETLASTAVGLCILLPALAAIWPDDERLALFREGVYIGVFAPKQQLSGPIYLKIRDRAESDLCQEIMSDPDIAVAITQSRGDSLAFTNGSRVSANTASESTMVEGDTLHLVLIDEAQRVSRAKVTKEISPMLAARNGSMVKIGTAWMSKGGFHNDITYNVEQHKRGAPRNHFQFDYQQVCREKRALYERQRKEYTCGKRKTPPSPFHLKYEKWLNAELKRLGGNKDSEEFKMNFRLLWQESRTIAIQEAHLLGMARDTYEMNVPQHSGLLFAGLDVAKSNDSTVLTILEVDINSPVVDTSARTPLDAGKPILYYNKRIIGWTMLQGSFEGVQYQEIVNFMKLYRVCRLIVDATGVGDPVCERLQVLLSGFDGLAVEPFVYSTPSKSNLFKYYLQEITANRLVYPAGPDTIAHVEYQEFLKQHIDLEREYNGSYLVCQAPEGEHDDFPCSSALAVWAAKDVETYVATSSSHNVPLVEVVQTTNASYRRAGFNTGLGAAPSRADRYLHGRRG